MAVNKAGVSKTVTERSGNVSSANASGRVAAANRAAAAVSRVAAANKVAAVNKAEAASKPDDNFWF